MVSYGEDGGWHCLPIAAHEWVLPVVAIPDYEVPTKIARGLIPETVPHREAAINSGRAALLTQAISTYPDFLLPATSDLLHQPYRAVAMKPSAALVSALRGQGYAAVISGAGPTVMVLANGKEERASVLDAIERLTSTSDINEYESSPISWRVLPVDIDTEGVMLTHEE